ncbi:MAG: hypothetical protein U9N81_12800 [Bacillota bacterium]|nr:hypothetical protein [Bacillota bacterium]
MKKRGKSLIEVISMNKQQTNIFLFSVLLASFGLGYIMADVFRSNDVTSGIQKPVVQVQEKVEKIDEETPVVFEKEYLRSNRIVIDNFDNRASINGLTVEDIKERYTEANQFYVVYENGSLLIHQKIDDWCPADKDKWRLKPYKGMVAIYRGPDNEHDVLQKVTAIRIDSLPVQVRVPIENQSSEFPNENALNDALENLDEYIP